MIDYEARRRLAHSFDGVPYDTLDKRARLVVMSFVYQGVLYLEEVTEVVRLV